MRLTLPNVMLCVLIQTGGCATAAPVGSAAPGRHRPASVARPARTHQIVAEDYFTISHVNEARPSPGGERVAYVEARWSEDLKRRNADLWVVSSRSRARTRLTFDPAADRSPRWSPDGRWIYFLSGRKRGSAKKAPWDGKPQIWRIRHDGAGLMPVTREKKGVRQFEVSASGRALYYTVSKEHFQKGPWKKLRKEFKKLKYGHGVLEPTRLWRLDLRSWRAEKLIDLNRVIRDFRVAPDEKHIALLTTTDRHLITNEGGSRLDIWSAATKKIHSPDDAGWRARAPSPYGWLESPRWSSDGQHLAFRVDFDGYPGEIFVLRLAGGDPVKVTSSIKLARRDEETVSGEVAWRPGKPELCYAAIRRARVRVYCTAVSRGRQGKAWLVTAGKENVENFAFFASGRRLAAVMSGLMHPPDVFSIRAARGQRRYERLTRVNPQVDTWKLPRIKTVRWKSKDGTFVEGILELPPGYRPGKPLPLLVELHGGPTAATKLRFRYWIYGRTLFAARGWAMFSPNYRGSTGYGDKFLTDLVGHKNHLDVEDIESGVDALISRGVADPKKLALMGWSNGGYLTNCIIGRTTRYKAASSGAGVVDTAMQWMIEDTPGHVVNFNRGLPWQRAAEMKASSPLYSLHRVRTPTIIHVGSRDPRVPPQHSMALYRALRRYLSVPTELIVYKGEPHSLTRRKHRLAKLRWDLRWMDYWVLGKKRDDADPKKKESR